MLKMLILKGRVLTKNWPVISPDIHANILNKTTMDGGRRPPPTVVFSIMFVANIRRDGWPGFCGPATLQDL